MKTSDVEIQKFEAPWQPLDLESTPGYILAVWKQD
jgi:hypothetical protein